jgi:hypothetical protein
MRNEHFIVEALLTLNLKLKEHSRGIPQAQENF